MPRYKPDLSGQSQLVPVDFGKQVLPGTFEHALVHLIDWKLDCSAFDARYCNEVAGATAYDPRLLLKIVLLGYSRGLISSRRMEAACRENVVFMAVSGGEMPHFTTLAGFVADNHVRRKSESPVGHCAARPCHAGPWFWHDFLYLR